jgi:myo-inositol-1(or 4)-monophosphatase
VATGRFDAYIERGISLWDIAAGGLIVECAGASFGGGVGEGQV